MSDMNAKARAVTTVDNFMNLCFGIIREWCLRVGEEESNG